MTPHFSVSSSGHLVIQTLKSRVREVSLQTPAVSDIKNTWLSLYPCQSLSQAWTINSYKTTSGKSIKPLVNVQQRFIVRIKKTEVCERELKTWGDESIKPSPSSSARSFLWIIKMLSSPTLCPIMARIPSKQWTMSLKSIWIASPLSTVLLWGN